MHSFTVCVLGGFGWGFYVGVVWFCFVCGSFVLL